MSFARWGCVCVGCRGLGSWRLGLGDLGIGCAGCFLDMMCRFELDGRAGFLGVGFLVSLAAQDLGKWVNGRIVPEHTHANCLQRQQLGSSPSCSLFVSSWIVDSG